MALKSNIDPMPRGSFFSLGGKSIFDGLTNERPKPEPQEAIDVSAALIPTPSFTNAAFVSASQGGTFTTGFVMADFVFFNGQNVTLSLSQAVGVTLSSGVGVEIPVITNDFTGGKCIELDGKDTIGLLVGVCNPLAPNMIGINVTGNVDNLGLNIGLFRPPPAATGATCIKYTASSTTPVIFNTGIVSLEGDNQTFLDYDPASASDVFVINVSSIEKNSSTGAQGFIARGGRLVIESSGRLTADTILTVKSGAIVTWDSADIDGDIIVDSGGVLNIGDIFQASGSITNNGTINGIINGVPFGNYITNGAPSAFAHFFQQNNSAITDIINQDQFEDINCSLTGQLLQDFTISGNTATYTGTEAINVQISLSVSIIPGGANKDIMRLKVFKNDSTGLNGEGQGQFSPNGSVDVLMPLTLFTVASLVQNNTIDLKVANGSNGTDIVVEEITGIIREIK